jgi:hypothetical protein
MPSGRDSFRRNRVAPCVRSPFYHFCDWVCPFQGPPPLFSEVRILKELWIRMLQVRIVKGLREDDCG